MTFEAPWTSFIPQRFPLHGTRDIIAPLWTDLDNRLTGQVYYNQYTSGSVLKQATQDINTYFPGLNFNANWVFVATWYEVAYYPNSGTAGYDTINSTHHYTIPGSFSPSATGPNSNFRLSSNVNVAGRWAFRVERGSTGCTFNGEPVQLGDSFWSDSTCAQKCTCTSSGLQCVRQPCSFSQICRESTFQFSCQTVQRRTCTISGDPHYYTFDNNVFHFQGTCTYVLSEQCGHGLPYYRVEGKNEHRGSTHVSWTRLVKVFVHNETIEIVKGHRGQAKESCICNSGYISVVGSSPHSEVAAAEGQPLPLWEKLYTDEDCGDASCSYGTMTCRHMVVVHLNCAGEEDGERGCRPNSYETCWDKGPRIISTFDGVTYQYPGACRLTLPGVMGLSQQFHFVLDSRKVPRGQQGFTRPQFEAEGTCLH
ncbi:IgGFc-binding protein-like protein [Lates japonicus]|uniref:IgGFc-binding protein-like protein n=1 Tax=Lates japonicus TaxID=270547 RepID=A0AAD3MLV8_LATJO|nr:IgGFc-binding protein-like protein [Lates japonicus]